MTFLGFIVLFIVVSGIANLVENIPLYLGTYTPQVQDGLSTVTHLTSKLINTIFSPLWVLTALTLFLEFRREQVQDISSQREN
jgi:hypothetical protein